MTRKFEHICEVCGITKVMTLQEAFQEGWDYPPLMGSLGVINMTDGTSEIGKSIQLLNNHLLQFYIPAVQDICNRENITESELEHFLDYLVSACISDDMIFLFKKVCIRFYKEYPETIAEYIMFYKELYEDAD